LAEGELPEHGRFAKKEEGKKMPARRIDPEQARPEVNSGNALLVCAYDDQEKYQKYRLTHAVAMDELEAHQATLPKGRKLIFYCA
jgi:hypothetical protein